MPQQRKHGGEVNPAPASAVNGDVFGCGAVARVKNVDFHKSLMSLRAQVSRNGEMLITLRDRFVHPLVMTCFPSTIS